MSRYRTEHLGITMEWSIERGRYHNAANPFTIVGYVDGECRMSHAVRPLTYEQAEKRVIARLDDISRDSENAEIQAIKARQRK